MESLHTVAPEFQANIGYLSIEEQHRIGEANIVVVGAGGGGGPAAKMLTRMGFGAEGGSLTLTDPETFEPRNINRQEGCTQETFGHNKASALGNELRGISPNTEIRVFTDGVTEENIDEMFDGADLIIDESAFELPQIGTMVARAARARKLPVISGYDVGFGGYVTTYHPDGPIFEEKQLGIKPTKAERELGYKRGRDLPLENIAQHEVPISKWTPYLPTYADYDMFKRVANKEMSAPTNVVSAGITAGIVTQQALLNILAGANKRPQPVYYNKALLFDPMSPAGNRIIKFNEMSHYRHGVRMLLRNMMHQNPQTA